MLERRLKPLVNTTRAPARWRVSAGCEPRSVLVLLLLCLPTLLHAAEYTRWTTNYYNLTGSTIREIRRSILHHRPAQVDREALTEWNIRSRFGVARLQGGYRCSGFTTTTTIRITLPRWTPPEGVSESVKKEWQRYIAALKQHEEGHARFALAAVEELHRRVAALGIERDPEALKSAVNSLVSQTIQEYRNREGDYDELTHHGIDQGATLRGVERTSDGQSFGRGERDPRADRRRGRGTER